MASPQALNHLVDFLAVDGHFPGAGDSQADLVAPNLHDGDDDVVVAADAELAGEAPELADSDGSRWLYCAVARIP